MRVYELASRLDRLQNSGRFKRIAGVATAALTLIAIGVLGVLAAAPDTAGAVRQTAEQASRAQEALQSAQEIAAGGAATAGRAAMSAPLSPTLLGSLLILALGALALAAILMGLALTYLALGTLGALVAAPLLAFHSTRTMGEMCAGAFALVGAFATTSQGLRLLLARASPVFAVARNVLAEAVRMKISVVFIVLLVFFLAGLPFFLDPSQPLRYRVQLFLTYGTGGTYWTLALLTVFFAVASVAFEQRDKIVWQTMTKPVAPWQYVLGKWLGVTALNTALLGVAASGVFLFTQRLRFEPAQGEVRAYVNLDSTPEPSNDRRLLESQVLTARVGRALSPPVLDMKLINQQVEEAVDDEATRRAGFTPLRSARPHVRERLIHEANLQHRTIEPGHSRVYVFEGLGGARGSSRPLTVRFKVNSGSDNPSNLLRVSFLVGGRHLVQREAVLNTAQVFDIPDDAVPRGAVPDAERARLLADIRAQAIDDQGKVSLEVFNGDPATGAVNPRPISFPPDGLEVLYAAGSYESNFLRVAATLWLKLAFVAAVAVAASTFLSYPVACLVSMGVLFIAETSSYLNESLEYYQAESDFGMDYGALVARIIAVPVGMLFRWYGSLAPTASLADGRLVGLETLLEALAYLGGCTAAALLIGWAVFRKRELAIYSGK